MTRHESTSSYHGIKNGDNAVEFPTKRTEFSSSSGPRFIQTTDNRIPISIPFTTPASEFLYGTSVVEAALSSRREPRRKLYKLYVYTGENREDTEQDARLEKLARKARVDVVRVGNDWLRVMDKMSAGRPHNGYILEASPLPRLPVKSLGQLTTSHDQDGFEVSIDYQSREEAAVNGASKFIKTVRSQHGRKPLVLLLDSIVDPGNLGGIIRTASFLGVTAIAISTRNSASFTPVVLKASAGASEDVTLFTVNKPAGFVVDSKAAGWKVFAAVAPAKKDDPAMPASLSTEDLDDPLCKDPCILMLGSEGEGLRWNLRSKADVDLYIKGSRESHKVDSLNVSVAAGILCNAFLARSKPVKVTPIRQEQDKEAPKTPKLF
jgi:21S rRNA (GM2251-2'-O)-methyltransferase